MQSQNVTTEHAAARTARPTGHRIAGARHDSDSGRLVDEEEEFEFFQYVETEEGASLVTNMDDEDIAEILSQFIQRDTEGRVH